MLRSSLHYLDVIAAPRYKDIELEYHDKSMWVHLGLGYYVNHNDLSLFEVGQG